MAFQLSGTTWIDSNGHFQQGFKSVNGTTLAGSGNITTGPSSVASFGTNWNVIGCLTIGYNSATYTYNTGGVFVDNGLYNNGYTRRGPEPNQNVAASDIYQPTYTGQNNYVFYSYYAQKQGYIQSPTGHSGLSAGTWKSLTPGHEDQSYTWHPYNLFIRVS